MIAATLVLAASAVSTVPTIAGLTLGDARGAGAQLPFLEYEAENGRTDGMLIGPDRRFGTWAAEASGRQAIRLDRPDQSLAITLAAPGTR